MPTTTGSIRPSVAVHLSRSATVPFGWRPIVRSANLAAPFSTYTGPSGLRVESFDDVVRAREIQDAVAIGLVGPEAHYVTIRFDYSANASMVAPWQGTPGSYSNYNAISYDNYISWIDGGDQDVSHEYEHVHPTAGRLRWHPPPPPAPVAFDVSTPVVAPTPVARSGTVSSSISGPASVTIEIGDGRGSLLRTALPSASPAGGVSATWDRKDASGRRAKAGAYSAVVRAVTADGRPDSRQHRLQRLVT